MKTQQQMAEELGVRPYFYYVGTAIGTVCLLKKENSCVARGVSICSPQDQFNRATGRAKAFGRAIKAVVRKETNDRINVNRLMNKYYPSLHPKTFINEVSDMADTFTHKSIYMPELTEFERRIIYKPVKAVTIEQGCNFNCESCAK